MTDIDELGRRVAEAWTASREIDAALWWRFEHSTASRAYNNAKAGLPAQTTPDEYPQAGLGTAYLERAAPAYTASVDAALALVERMLPGTHRHVSIDLFSTGRSGCILNVNTDDEMHTDGATAPLAIIAALLNALSSIRPNGGAEE